MPAPASQASRGRLRPRWFKAVVRAGAAAVAFGGASRAVEGSSSDAVWGGLGAGGAIFAIEAWLLLRNRPTEGEPLEEAEEPEQDWRPPLFGNG